MSVPPFLKVNGAANILFLLSLLDMRLINNIFLVAVIFYWTCFFLVLLAIATSFVGVLFSSDDFAVVAFDGSSNVFAGAVGHFHCVAVDDFPQGVSSREAIFDEPKEFGTTAWFQGGLNQSISSLLLFFLRLGGWLGLGSSYSRIWLYPLFWRAVW